MLHVYEPFINKRMAEGRLFFVNPKMPFEYFLDCFEKERPFFFVSHLEDGRIAITPNASYFPKNWQTFSQWLPKDFEYVTLKNSTYPLIITAHPVNNPDQWLRRFEQWVTPFAKQTLAEFVTNCTECVPLAQRPLPIKEREMIPT
ncbi:MAG: hypothetical protein HKO59_16215 [Phycisphaerales bacterium]|nr:hypothetical protein [Phycisphaerae bacterium]NNF42931.1 hypothetical protein [Phycisphaerales bacterium]NNM27497.1 hypothetical protein [Phycisphaerales bacterium]